MTNRATLRPRLASRCRSPSTPRMPCCSMLPATPTTLSRGIERRCPRPAHIPAAHRRHDCGRYRRRTFHLGQPAVERFGATSRWEYAQAFLSGTLAASYIPNAAERVIAGGSTPAPQMVSGRAGRSVPITPAWRSCRRRSGRRSGGRRPRHRAPEHLRSTHSNFQSVPATPDGIDRSSDTV